MVGDFNILLLVTDKRNTQKCNKNTEDLNHIINKFYLTDMYKTQYQKNKIQVLLKYTGTFTQKMNTGSALKKM